MPTFVVERYLPGVSREQAEAVIRRESEEATQMAGEGRVVRILHATLVEGDEAVMSVVSAPTHADVVELGRRSGTPADRVTPAIEMQPTAAPGEDEA